MSTTIPELARGRRTARMDSMGPQDNNSRVARHGKDIRPGPHGKGYAIAHG